MIPAQLSPGRSRQSFRHWFAAGSLLALLAGCGSFSDVAQEDAYQPPPPGAPVATLRGTSISESGLFGSEYRGFVNMIDLKAIPNAASHWNDPVALTPGKHTIVAEYHYSNFMTRAYVPLEAKAGTNYQIMIKQGREDSPTGTKLYNDFWIVDIATGNPVTPSYRRQLSGGKTGTIFYQTK